MNVDVNATEVSMDVLTKGLDDLVEGTLLLSSCTSGVGELATKFLDSFFETCDFSV